MKKNIYYPTAVIAAGCLWGTMGIFRRHLGDVGFSSIGIVFIRCAVASLLYAITIFLTDRRAFRIHLKDLWVFLCEGIVSVLFFSMCYFTAMNMMSLSIAAILLYTAPIFVILFSAVLFHEKITVQKIIAIVLAFGGCCLVSGIVGSEARISLIGFLYGLGAGIGYALYSIFGKIAMDRGYGSLTVTFYCMLIAAVGALFLEGPAPVRMMTTSAGTFFFCILAAIVTTYLPYMLYTFGLRGVEPGKASIMASVEPVVATIVGLLVFHEVPGFWSYLGILLVLSAIVLLNTKGRGNSHD